MGAVTGAAAALLIAPAVNEETRRKMAEKAAPLKDLLTNNLDNLTQYGLSMLKNYANGAAQGESSPLHAVVQAIVGEKKTKAKGDKKEGKKSRKKEPKDGQ